MNNPIAYEHLQESESSITHKILASDLAICFEDLIYLTHRYHTTSTFKLAVSTHLISLVVLVSFCVRSPQMFEGKKHDSF